jgi:hypothetical protein
MPRRNMQVKENFEKPLGHYPTSSQSDKVQPAKLFQTQKKDRIFFDTAFLK